MGIHMASRDLPLPLTLLMAPQAYRLDPNRPLGRQSAGAGFLEGYLRYGGNQRHHLVVTERSHGEWFHREACQVGPEAETVLASLADWGTAAAATGAIALPGPGLDEWAWKRMPWGDGAFSLVGLVHTLCSRPVQWGLGQFSGAPVRPWDALICTSSAARTVVEGFLERQEAWLEQRLGAQRFERPQLPVIPLGVHPHHWAPGGGKTQAQAMARQRLGIAADAQVVLLAGRLDVLTKFHPGPLLRVLAELQREECPHLLLLIYGEAPNPAMEQLWRAGVEAAGQRLPVHWVPGRELDLAAPVRWAADLFVSLADNPQETFGITPLEAMAAELPCLVSDWDGYRDTVTSEVGLRVPTRMVAGLGTAEAQGLLSETLPYDQAVGRVGQGIAVDPAALRAGLRQLLGNRERRREMGQAARRRVDSLYSWQRVIEQWRLLLGELGEQRAQARRDGTSTAAALPPWLPSCSDGFGAFASEVLAADGALQGMPGDLGSLVQERLSEPLDRWDGGLAEELQPLGQTSAVGELSARAKGWLLKQGLAQA
jgi:glycosyltransferase involved in cell wall biosynthesis